MRTRCLTCLTWINSGVDYRHRYRANRGENEYCSPQKAGPPTGETRSNDNRFNDSVLVGKILNDYSDSLGIKKNNKQTNNPFSGHVPIMKLQTTR